MEGDRKLAYLTAVHSRCIYRVEKSSLGSWVLPWGWNHKCSKCCENRPLGERMMTDCVKGVHTPEIRQPLNSATQLPQWESAVATCVPNTPHSTSGFLPASGTSLPAGSTTALWCHAKACASNLKAPSAYPFALVSCWSPCRVSWLLIFSPQMILPSQSHHCHQCSLSSITQTFTSPSPTPHYSVAPLTRSNCPHLPAFRKSNMELPITSVWFIIWSFSC